MQQANELRIGNLVRNIEGTICPVTQLALNEMGHNISVRCIPASAKFGGYIEEVTPIALTSKILISLGFAEDIDYVPRKLYRKEALTLNSYFQLCTYDGSMTLNDKRIEYIHQLQNLYLLVTGSELEININEID